MEKLYYSFPKLNNFLAGYVADSEDEGFETDIEVAQYFVQTESKIACSEVLREGKEVLSQVAFPWEEVADSANRYFEDSESAKKWFQELMDVFESTELDA